ncbi:MAG: hypothetical protein PWQ27_411 [Kosmotoga sp.]|uniref:Transcriptional regulator n=3 Tax=Kosmotoga TaxID=651456 RepID=B5M6M6_KOSOT|nr:transcriptional regulator [Kosmotoga olearia TBF 19.5.1]MDK2953028.1 hypothetical protein [Kosmotoga sp.]
MIKRGESMNIGEFSFFNPSPNFREMSILKAIAETPSISQERLAAVAGVVPSMINRYIKDFEEQEYIVKEGENRRKMQYILTEKGRFRLQFLTISYLREVAKLYVQSRETFGEVLDKLKDEGYERLLLYGAGIIGSILVDVLRTEGFVLVGFVDDSLFKQGSFFHDLKVYSPEEVSKLEYDGIIVASFKHADTISKNAIRNGMKNIMVFEISSSGTVSIRRINGGSTNESTAV